MEMPPVDIQDLLVVDIDFHTPLPTVIACDGRSTNQLHHALKNRPDLTKLGSAYEWPRHRKQYTLFVSCLATVFASVAASAYAPAKTQMADTFHVSSTAILVGITSFSTGFGVAPMFVAPLSELRGRKPIFAWTGLLFVVCQICCAVDQSYGGMIAARFFAGCGSSTHSTMVGGVIADMCRAEERNTPMTIFTGAALFGMGLGPLISGFIAQYSTWRWIFWMQVIVNGITALLFVFTVPGTRQTTILDKRVARLNKWCRELEKAGATLFEMPSPRSSSPSPQTHRSQLGQRTRKLEFRNRGASSHKSIIELLSKSLYLPARLLFTEPVVFFCSLWAAFSWSILYIQLGIIPLVFENTYHFSLSHAEAVFTASCLASLIGVPISIIQEKKTCRFKSPSPTSSDSPSDTDTVQQLHPEHRLYATCIQSLLLPTGLFLFGWSSQAAVHWIVPTIAISLATLGIFAVYLAVFNYLADIYHTYASSALAAQSFCRNVMGGVLVLATEPLFHRLGYGPASSLLGGVGLVLTLGPWVLVFWGDKIRSRSQFATHLRTA